MKTLLKKNNYYKMKITKYIFQFLILVIYSYNSFSQNHMQAPESYYSEVSNGELIYGSGKNTVLNFYQNWISPVKGGNLCPMYPSCSQYSIIIFQNNSPLNAYIGTYERLLRCGRELYLYDTIYKNGRLYWYDPPLIESIHSMNYITFNNQSSNSLINKQKTFADYLFDNGEYYRALTEYHRMLYNSQNVNENLFLLKKIGLCYYFGKDWSGYIDFIQKYRNVLSQDRFIINELDIYWAKVYYHLKEFTKSIKTLEWCTIDSTNNIYNEYLFMLGLSYSHIFHWEASNKYFSKISSTSSRYMHSNTFSKKVLEGGGLPECKPWLAGSLSTFVPGLGYLYSHRYGTALSSFVINGLLIWSTIESFSNDNYALSTSISLFAIGWYLGNIKGSINAANKYNQTVRTEFINNIFKDVNVDKIN